MDRAGLGYRPSPVEPHRSSLSPAISVTWIREGKGQQTGLLSLKSCPIGWGPEVHQATSSCFSFASCHTCYYRARKEMTHERLLASARQSMSMCVCMRACVVLIEKHYSANTQTYTHSAVSMSCVKSTTLLLSQSSLHVRTFLNRGYPSVKQTGSITSSSTGLLIG